MQSVLRYTLKREEMQSLQEKAAEWSGVQTAHAFAIDETNLFHKLGLQTFVNLSTNFYNRVKVFWFMGLCYGVYIDEEVWFRSIFANSKKENAIQNQYEFLVQRMGGPSLYSQRRGHPALIARHRPFPVTHQAAERWIHHMQQAMDSTLDIEDDSKIKTMNFYRFIFSRLVSWLWKTISDDKFHNFLFFKHTAYFLVAGVELKNKNLQMPCKDADKGHPCKNY